MAKCDLQIVFDRADRTYKIGEKITGSVRVTVKEDCECRKLTIARQWYASGQGQSDQATPEEEQVIFSGAWRAGQTAAYPFENEAPRGPLTYHGSLFNVGWQLRASADIPGIDATTREDFALLLGPSSENVRLGILNELPPQVRNSSDKTAWSYAGGCTQLFVVLFGVVLLFVGIPCLILGLSNILAEHFPLSLPISFPAGRFQSILLIGMGGFFTVLGCIALFAWFQASMARPRLVPVQVEVSPRTLRRGETVTCTVRLQPRGSIKLTEATVKVAATEHTSPRTGDTDDAPTHASEQTVFQAREVLATGRTVPAGEEVLLRIAFSIPANAPCTFWGGNNKLIWAVAVELKLKRWPDCTRIVPITIRP
jgi:hypothetical protein